MNWWCLNRSPTSNCFLYCDFLTHAFQRITPFKFLEFHGRVLIQKLVNWQEPTTDFDLNLVTLYFDHDTTASKLVDSLRLSHKHYLKLLAFRVVVYVVSKLLVDRVAIHRNVDSNPWLQVNYVAFKRLIFSFKVPYAGKEFKWGTICSIALIFETDDVVGSWPELLLDVLKIYHSLFETVIFLLSGNNKGSLSFHFILQSWDSSLFHSLLC